MQTKIDNSRGRRAAMAVCLAYVFAGQFFIPLLGIQNDEALFASPILEPKSWEYAVQVGKSHWALMLMTYLGTLKSLLYKPLLRWFGTGAWSVREPMLLASAASVWLFYLLLRRSVSDRAAVVGCCLLASDSLYLLTSVFDWGPVALQHLLTVGGMLLAMYFYQENSVPALAAGCFLFGLALWDKALAAWMLSGLAAATALLFWREIRQVASMRRLGVAAAAFLLGASPLLVYNYSNHWSTFHDNARLEKSDIAQKAQAVVDTVRGGALIGFFAEEFRRPPMPHGAYGYFQSASEGMAEAAGHPRHNLMVWGIALALLLTPLARGRDLRATLFVWVTLAVAWTQMALTAHAGSSVHHTILLWPLPCAAIAIPLAAASRRILRAGVPMLAAVTVLLATSSAAVTNEYYFRMLRQGGSIPWSDAIWPLSGYLKSAPASYIYCVDWGMLDSLRLISRGKLTVREGTEHTSRPVLTPEDRDFLRGTLAIPGLLFVGHTTDAEIFKGDTARLLQAAADAGFRPELLVTIDDSFGRPTFEVYRFAAAP